MLLDKIDEKMKKSGKMLADMERMTYFCTVKIDKRQKERQNETSIL